MARLETQINQIYLTDPANKKVSLLLYEEQISSSAHLFVLAEITDIKKKTESADLKRISEIILESFRANKKLAAESLFESSLAQINQNLADLAHSGHKSWVGKFSAVIALSAKGGSASGGKSGDNIFVANNGACSCFLHRKGELLEILPAEKRGDHPFKTFINFTQGKLVTTDSLILNTANIFNYISLEHFNQILNSQELEPAGKEISKILQDSTNESQAFCAFFLNFRKPQPEAVKAQIEPIPTEIYAPLPEDMEETAPKLPRGKFRIPKLPWPESWATGSSFPRFRLPSTHKLLWSYFWGLSKPAKFFFVSFAIFLLLFLVNLTNYFFNHSAQKTQQKINNQITLINQELTDAQSAIIYKNETQALTIMQDAQKNFDVLMNWDKAEADKLLPRLENVKTQINKISRVENPQIIATLKRDPQYLGKAPTAFLISGVDSNSLAQFNTTLKEYFLLNSLKQNVTGIAFLPQVGVVVASGNTIFKVDQAQQQFLPALSLSNSDFLSLRAYGNILYMLDGGQSQVIKIAMVKNKLQSTKITGITAGEVRDIGADKDLYILSADKLTKVVNGQSVNVVLPNLTDEMTNANKIFVGTNLYILEANKKRVVIFTKTGQLLNQIYFPNAQNLHDLYVDEAGRSLYLLDGDKFEKITL